MSLAEQAVEARQIGSITTAGLATWSINVSRMVISMNTKPESEDEDYYETFAGRGQEDQDEHDLLNGHPSGEAQPEKPGEPTSAWPFPKSAD